MKEIIILGAGAVGSVLGAILSSNYKVTLAGNKSHIAAINQKGLYLKGLFNRKFSIKAVTKIKKIGPKTLVIITTKAYDLIPALKSIKPLLRKDTLIAYLQNGLGLEDEAKKIIKKNIFRGVALIGATFLKPGEVIYNSPCRIILETNPKLRQFLKDSKLEIKYVKNIMSSVWQKAMVNCVLNSLTALYQVSNGGLLKHKNMVKAVSKECIQIAKKSGVHIRQDTEKNIFAVIRRTKDNKSSMYQDILKGKKTEIDYLNGAIVRLAEKHKIKAPINYVLTGIIKSLEK